MLFRSTLVTGASAESIQLGNAQHTVSFRVGAQEHSIEATRVLVNAGPQVFDRLLGRSHEVQASDEGSVAKVNLLLHRLPRLRADVDPSDAFRGTFHVDEGYEAMQQSYRQAAAGQLPDRPPFEAYCHTLTDDSILGPSLRERGYHTLTLFGLDVPYRLFETEPDATKAELVRRYFHALNRYLVDPIEDCLAVDQNGKPCVEAKTPPELERELALNRGNIFHRAPSWFFGDDESSGRWGVETEYERIYRCGASAIRGGAVSGIPGHNAAKCIFEEMGR